MAGCEPAARSALCGARDRNRKAATMRTYSFSIAAVPLAAPRDSDAIVDALYEAGCDDALVTERAGCFLVEFDREGPSFAHAVLSAIRAVAKSGLKPRRIGPDPLVTAADIAERAGVSRQVVSNYTSAKRRRGFPRPVARQETGSPLWEWADVAGWLAEGGNKVVTRRDVVLARQIERLNGRLDGSILPIVAKHAPERPAA